MTVGELRAALADYPDEKRIVFETREDSFDDVAVMDYGATGWNGEWSPELRDAVLVFVR